MIITLTPTEQWLGAQVGLRRMQANRERGSAEPYGAIRNGDAGAQIDIEGASAELAFAKWSGLYWSGVAEKEDGTWSADLPDVGPFFIRSTKHEKGHLIMHDRDPDDGMYVLVIGRSPTYRIAGWIRAGDGKIARFEVSPNDPRRSGPGRKRAYWVPQSALRAIRPLEL